MMPNRPLCHIVVIHSIDKVMQLAAAAIQTSARRSRNRPLYAPYIEGVQVAEHERDVLQRSNWAL